MSVKRNFLQTTANYYRAACHAVAFIALIQKLEDKISSAGYFGPGNDFIAACLKAVNAPSFDNLNILDMRHRLLQDEILSGGCGDEVQCIEDYINRRMAGEPHDDLHATLRCLVRGDWEKFETYLQFENLNRNFLDALYKLDCHEREQALHAYRNQRLQLTRKHFTHDAIDQALLSRLENRSLKVKNADIAYLRNLPENFARTHILSLN